jgi:hypothetical protein
MHQQREKFIIKNIGGNCKTKKAAYFIMPPELVIETTKKVLYCFQHMNKLEEKT